ncbi:DUF2059 domain-containing protein [Occallatibacter riparius]|uniref:DUF2059 domain-containing protein n=1 Tax=Occallatibacter riparius TaxID=1002689 RepID=UPI0028C37BBD|nr:DUF2059 domain-containing protein [Occallatibacter riparius]
MMNRSKLVVVLTLALGALPFAVAQAPATEITEAQTKPTPVVPEDQRPTASQLDRLFEVMRLKEQLASTTKLLPQLAQQQMAQEMDGMVKDHPELANLTPEQKQKATQVVSKFAGQALTLFSSDEVIAEMKTIYQRHLTGNDVENLIGFYGTPSGQHMLDMVPVVMQEFLPNFMQKMQAKMRPLVAEMAKEMAAIVAPAAGDKAPAKPDQPK